MSLPAQPIIRQPCFSEKYEPSPEIKITEQACFAKVNQIRRYWLTWTASKSHLASWQSGLRCRR